MSGANNKVKSCILLQNSVNSVEIAQNTVKYSEISQDKVQINTQTNRNNTNRDTKITYVDNIIKNRLYYYNIQANKQSNKHSNKYIGAGTGV